ncbi:unnamed protein product [Blepharisma stoltei]|uniref:FACT complex subunit SSRP1 n=1 Tax=Blepharisma stoltei TaxID=1481888 RepID=A0AAU9JZB6_9CILI|nr:unnamed protein product [Blepharisma stoltei]
MAELSTKGWSWGDLNTTETGLDFSVDAQPCFTINYKDIANCAIPGKNEVALEFQQDDTMEDDILCEMRLYVPDPDSCEKIAKEISDRADLRAYSGDAIVTLYDLPMIVPRGKCSLDMFHTFMRLHGKTHNYKIMYKNVTRAFLLPKPDGIHVAIVIGLEPPIRQGNTLYPFVVLQFNKEQEESVSLNLAPEEIKKNFGEDLTPTIEGKAFDVISRLFKAMVKINIIIPGTFRSFNDTHAIKCSVRASEGHLYPLQKSFIFISKPVIYIRFEDIRFIEFARVSEHSMSTNRSFDLNVTTKTGSFQFTGVDRQEYKNLFSFLEKKKIPIRNLEEEEDLQKEQILSSEGENMEIEDESEDDSFEASDSDA